MGKILSDSLTGKMVKRLLCSLFAGLFVFFVFYIGSYQKLKVYFFNTGYFYQAEVERVENFQKFVKDNRISTSDSTKIRKWVEERNIREFMISRENYLLFDISYEGEILPGGKKISNTRWKNYHLVTFHDGNAYVYVYEGAAEKYYRILLTVAVFLGLSTCLGIFVSGMQMDVKYIQRLQKEVEIISGGNLEAQVTIEGQDELAGLAAGLDRMRMTLKKKEQTENELRMAQKKLVLGMSHDLRTPLTGLLTYMEILKKQEREGKVQRKYIEKAYDRIIQMRTLSDEMFEYFLVNSRQDISLEEKETIISAFGDYLSEFCVLLEDEGFLVDTEAMEWKEVYVRLNIDYFGRIINNIISNLEKYGDKSEQVRLAIVYCEDTVGIIVKNKSISERKEGQGTGIGISNISMMMEQMGGTAEVEQGKNTYALTLYFPVYEK